MRLIKKDSLLSPWTVQALCYNQFVQSDLRQKSTLAVSPCFQSWGKAKLSVSSFIFNGQTWEWYWSFHLTLGKKANRCISPKCQTITLRDVYLLFSLWHLARALQRLGSGHRSSGDWPFLLRMVKSAPLAARKQAMDAALFFSAPWVPKPMINCRQTQTTQKKQRRRRIRGTSGFLTFDTRDCMQCEHSTCLLTPYTLAHKPLLYRVKSKKSK